MKKTFEQKIGDLVNKHKHGLIDANTLVQEIMAIHIHAKANLEQVALLRQEVIKRMKEEKAA